MNIKISSNEPKNNLNEILLFVALFDPMPSNPLSHFDRLSFYPLVVLPYVV